MVYNKNELQSQQTEIKLLLQVTKKTHMHIQYLLLRFFGDKPQRAHSPFECHVNIVLVVINQ